MKYFGRPTLNHQHRPPESLFRLRLVIQSLCHPHEVEHGIDARHVLEGEVLVVKHHPLLALPDRHMLNVGEEGNGDEHLAAIGQADQHLAAVGGEVQVLDTYCYVFHFTHIFVLL